MDEVAIITPEARPGEGGLGDYTLRVVEEWGARARVRFVVPAKKNFRAQLPAERGKILLQYSAYGFDRIGYPRWLLRELVDWKKTTPDSLLVVMLHEIWTFWPVLNKNYFVQRLHRADLRALASVADAVFTTTPSQVEHLGRLVPARAIETMPAGSTIRQLATSDGARETGLAVLFSLLGVRIAALRAMHAELKALAASQALRKLITVGKGSAVEDLLEEEKLLSALHLADGFEQRGALEEAEVSKILSRASYGLSAQSPRSLLKSSTFMAYAAHGLNILSPEADSLGEAPLCWLTSPAELRKGLATTEARSRAENLRAWQERTSSWPQIAERFAKALRLNLATMA